MSCGQTLLKGPKDIFDYCLYITDHKKTVKIYCHRSVLLSHSITMRNLIGAENFFDLTIEVKPGFLASMIELIQYMYLKNIALISNREKMLELCALLKMKKEYVLVNNSSCILNLETCQLTDEFQGLMEIKHAFNEDKSDVGVNKEESKEELREPIHNKTSQKIEKNLFIDQNLKKRKRNATDILFPNTKLRGSCKKLRSRRSY